MQLIGLLFWMCVFVLISKAVNALLKRPAMNPWYWLAGAYALGYVVGILFGIINNVRDLPEIAGSQLPLVLVSVVIGIWRGRLWQAARVGDGA
jgi:hypothetical protein